MPTRKPPKPDSATDEMNERRIAEFALEESRLSNLAYRFELRPRERVWRNWDRTEFEPNLLRVVGLAGVCLNRDEKDKAHRTASRALEDLDDIQFVVEEPAQAVIVRNPTGTSEIVNRPTICAEIERKIRTAGRISRSHDRVISRSIDSSNYRSSNWSRFPDIR
jgi:hypothetical protein